MNYFSDFDAGISKKIPAFLFPLNEVEYYNGSIPHFEKVIINKTLISNYKKHFKNNSIDNLHQLEINIRNKYENSDLGDLHSVSYDEYLSIYKVKFNKGFYLYDMIWVDCFMELEDSYEKAAIAEALCCIPNENDQVKEYFNNYFDDDDQLDLDDEEKEYKNDLLKTSEIFNKIDLFLSLKKKDFKKEKFSNPITSEFINHCYKNKKQLAECFVLLQQEDSTYNIGVKYIVDIELETYTSIEFLLQNHGLIEKEETDFSFHLNDDLEIKQKHLLNYDDIAHEFNLKFNELIMLWQQKQLDQKD